MKKMSNMGRLLFFLDLDRLNQKIQSFGFLNKLKTLGLFFFFFILCPLSKASEEVIRLYSKEGPPFGKHLTKLWAQEYAAVDLARKEIEKIRKRRNETSPSLPCTVIDVSSESTVSDEDDLSEDQHGILVSNLISHKQAQAVLPFSNRCKLIYLKKNSNEDILESESDPEGILHASLSLDGRLMKYLRRKNNTSTFLVKSAGNGFRTQWHDRLINEWVFQWIQNPKRWFKTTDISEVYQLEMFKENLGLFVGSLGPYGLVSDFSWQGYKSGLRDHITKNKSFSLDNFSHGNELAILAPSDYYILSLDDEGRETLFDGTSGAAPLVTGTLLAFNWISGHKLTLQQAKKLLSDTAVPLLSSLDVHKRNGNGLLNVLQIVSMAKRLKTTCESEDEEKEKCFEEALSNPKTYRFPLDLETSGFPQCLIDFLNQSSEKFETSETPETSIKFDCSIDDIKLEKQPSPEKQESLEEQENPEEQESLEEQQSPEELHSSEKQKSFLDPFNRLRKAAFLNPEKAFLWKAIANIYRINEISINAFHYRSVALAAEIQGNHLYKPGVKLHPDLENKVKDFLNSILSSLEPSDDNEEENSYKRDPRQYFSVLRTFSSVLNISPFETLKYHSSSPYTTFLKEGLKPRINSFARSAYGLFHHNMGVRIPVMDKELFVLSIDFFLTCARNSLTCNANSDEHRNWDHSFLDGMNRIILSHSTDADSLEAVIQFIAEEAGIEKLFSSKEEELPQMHKQMYLVWKAVLKLNEEEVSTAMMGHMIQWLKSHTEWLKTIMPTDIPLSTGKEEIWKKYKKNDVVGEIDDLMRRIVSHENFSQIHTEDLENMVDLSYFVFHQASEYVPTENSFLKLFMERNQPIIQHERFHSMKESKMDRMVLNIGLQKNQFDLGLGWNQWLMTNVKKIFSQPQSVKVSKPTLEKLILTLGYQSWKGELEEDWFIETIDVIFKHKEFKNFSSNALINTALLVGYQSEYSSTYLGKEFVKLLDVISESSNANKDVLEQITWILNQVNSLATKSGLQLRNKICSRV